MLAMQMQNDIPINSSAPSSAWTMQIYIGKLRLRRQYLKLSRENTKWQKYRRRRKRQAWRMLEPFQCARKEILSSQGAHRFRRRALRRGARSTVGSGKRELETTRPQDARKISSEVGGSIRPYIPSRPRNGLGRGRTGCALGVDHEATNPQ